MVHNPGGDWNPGWGVVLKNHNRLTSWWLNHPSEKYARQIGSFPQVGMKIKNI